MLKSHKKKKGEMKYPSVVQSNLHWAYLWHLTLDPVTDIKLISEILHNFRQVLHGTAGGMSPQVQARSQQLPGSTPVSYLIGNSLITFSFSCCMFSEFYLYLGYKE